MYIRIDRKADCYQQCHVQTDSKELQQQEYVKISDSLNQTLQESEQRFKALAEATPVAVVISRYSDGEILYANAQLATTFGLPSDQRISHKMLDFYYDLADRKLLLSQLSKKGVLDNYEVQAKRVDGTPFWVTLSVRYLTVAGEPAILTTFHDITEHKEAVAEIKQQAEREKLVGRIGDRIRESLNLEYILKTTASEVRQLLSTDRVIIFRFHSDWSGEVAVESVSSEFSSIKGTSIYDRCFTENYVEPYRSGRISAIEDIYTAGLSQCHIDLLAQFQIRANLIVPIFFSSQRPENSNEDEDSSAEIVCRELWGLLVANHCSEPRKWQQWEINLLCQLAGQVAIAIKQAQLYQQLQEANQRLRQLAVSDGLTKLANRRRFDEYLLAEWYSLVGTGITLSLIMCDIDYFKAYNDSYGHLAGDFCLQQVAGAIGRAVSREADLVARYGGEEFAVILPNTDEAGAVSVAEGIGMAISELKIAHLLSPSSYVTLSMGVASMIPTSELKPEELVAAADRALYQAKRTGRDRYCLYENRRSARQSSVEEDAKKPHGI
ncbi:MAG: diguanylate cyclase [Hormoscilla sp.]